MVDEQPEYDLDVTVGDGKYRVVMPRGGGLRALRYGEEWRSCTGDGLILALAQEIRKYQLQNMTLDSARKILDKQAEELARRVRDLEEQLGKVNRELEGHKSWGVIDL